MIIIIIVLGDNVLVNSTDPLHPWIAELKELYQIKEFKKNKIVKKGIDKSKLFTAYWY